jgi:hypothetical protein
VLTIAIDRTESTSLLAQDGLQVSFCSSNLDLAIKPVTTAPMVAAPPTPNEM